MMSWTPRYSSSDSEDSTTLIGTGGWGGLALLSAVGRAAHGAGVLVSPGRAPRTRAAQAVRVLLAASRPSSPTEVSRILNFCTLPVTVIGNSWVKRT